MKSRKEVALPYTSADLRLIADRMDEVLNAISEPHADMLEDDWRWGLQVEIFTEGFRDGHIRAHSNGWLGFYPEGWDE